MNSISFQIFVQSFNIVVDSWKLSMLLPNMLWHDWPICRISGSNDHLQQQLEYTLLKPDCHCWWISKMQSGRENILEEPYAIKFCFKVGKNDTETFGMLHTAFGASSWIEHQFLSGIKNSRKTGSVWGTMRCVGGVRKSIHQSWLDKALGLGLICWGLKGVQERFRRKSLALFKSG